VFTKLNLKKGKDETGKGGCGKKLILARRLQQQTDVNLPLLLLVKFSSNNFILLLVFVICYACYSTGEMDNRSTYQKTASL
jgi:hypothetical protein